MMFHEITEPPIPELSIPCSTEQDNPVYFEEPELSLSWNHVYGAKYYEIILDHTVYTIDTVPQQYSMDDAESGVVIPVWEVLSIGDVHSIGVRAKNEYQMEMRDPCFFRLADPTPSLITPSFEVCGNLVSFDFDGLEGVSYELTIYDDDSKSNVIDSFTDADFTLSGSTRSLVLTLEQGNFYWEVQAVGFDTGFSSGQNVSVFTPPETPTGLSADSTLAGGGINEWVVTFVWDDVNYGMYEVEVDSGAGYSPDDISISGSSAFWTAYSADEISWRVRHNNGICDASEWVTATYTLIPRPIVPENFSGDGWICIGDMITVQWDDAGYGDYIIEMDDDPGMGTNYVPFLNRSSDGIPGLLSETFTPSDLGEFSFRIKHQHPPYEDSDWSVFDFTVNDYPTDPVASVGTHCISDSLATIDFLVGTGSEVSSIMLNGVMGVVTGDSASVDLTGFPAGSFDWEITRTHGSCSDTFTHPMTIHPEPTNPTLPSIVSDICDSQNSDVISWTSVVGQSYRVEYFNGSSWELLLDDVAGVNSSQKINATTVSGARFRISTKENDCWSTSYAYTNFFDVISLKSATPEVTPVTACLGDPFTLNWNGDANTDYHIQIKTSTDAWTTITWENSNLGGPGVTTANINPGLPVGTYDWRAQTNDSCGAGWSTIEGSSVITDNAGADPDPGNINICNGEAALLSWTNATGSSYTLQIKTDSDTWATTVWESTGETGLSALSGLLSTGVYNWRLIAEDPCNNGWHESPASIIVLETTDASGLIPTGDLCEGAVAELDWTVVGGHTYDVFVSTNTDLNTTGDTTLGLSTPLATHGGLSSGTYYWKVLAHNGSCDGTLVVSAPFVVTGLPTTPSLDPVTSICEGSNAVLHWTSAAGEDYLVEFLDSSGGATVVENWVSGIDTATVAAPGVDTDYSWRLTARDTASQCEASSSETSGLFSVLGIPGAFTVVDEPDGSDTTPTLEWNASSDATSYEVFVGACGSEVSVGTTASTDFTLTAPLSNGDYCFYVEALNDDGSTSCGPITSTSDPFTICVPLASPVNLQPDNSVCESATATFSWDSVTDAVGYEYYLGTGSGVDDIVSFSETGSTTTTFDLTGRLGQTLWFGVRAKDGTDCWGSFTHEDFVVSNPATPGTPSPVDSGSTCGLGVVTFSWGAVGGALGYEYRIDTVQYGDTLATNVVGGGTTDFTFDVSVYVGSSLYWGVRTQDAGGCWGAWSDWDVSVIDPYEVTSIDPIGSGCSGDTPTVTWSGNDPGNQYEVELLLSGVPQGSTVVTGLTTTFGSLGTGDYDVRVRPADSCNTGWQYEGGFTLYAIPVNPAIVGAVDLCNSVTSTITWDTSGGDSFEVEFYDGSAWSSVVPGVGTASQSGLADGSAYRWRLRTTKDGCAASSWEEAGPFSVTTVTDAAGLTVGDLCEGAVAELDWTVVGGHTYDVFVSTNTDLNTTGDTTLGLSTPLATHGGLSSGTYYWKVLAHNGSCDGTLVVSAPFVVTGLPTTPSLDPVTSICEGSNAVLHWTSAAGEDYLVEFLDSSGGATVVENWVSGIDTATVAAPGVDTDYSWRLTARDTASQCEASSSETSGLFSVLGIPGAFTVVDEPDGSDTTPTLEWNASSDATEYELRVYTTTDCSGATTQTFSTTGTSRTINVLTDGSYSFHVVASNTSGGTSCDTTSDCDAFTITTCTPPSTPMNLTMCSTGDLPISCYGGGTTRSLLSGNIIWDEQTTIQWDTVTGATGYRIYFDTIDPPTGCYYDVGMVSEYTFNPGDNTELTGASCPGQMYYIAVAAFNSGGSCISSPTSNLTVTSLAPQSTPISNSDLVSGDVIINEYLIDADSDQNGEYLELFNTLDVPIDIAGLQLWYNNDVSCSGSETRTTTIPATNIQGKSSIIPPRGTIVIMRKYGGIGTNCSIASNLPSSETSGIFGFGGVRWYQNSDPNDGRIFIDNDDAMVNSDGCLRLYRAASQVDLLDSQTYNSPANCEPLTRKPATLPTSGNCFNPYSSMTSGSTTQPGVIYTGPPPCLTPTVTFSPSDGGTIALDGDITLTFSSAMEVPTCCGSSNIFYVYPDSANWSYSTSDNINYTLSHSGDLTDTTVYHIEIDTSFSTICGGGIPLGAGCSNCTGYDVTAEAGAALATELFISEYGEGSSFNKWVEIYNGTGSAVNLANYAIWRISNGGSWFEASYGLSGTLNDGDTFVICNGSHSQLGSCDDTTGVLSHNGDDAIGLAKSGVLIDAVGEDGADPGTGWDVCGISNATADNTLVRKSSVASPNTNWAQSSAVATCEWDVYAQDTFTYMGSHTFAP